MPVETNPQGFSSGPTIGIGDRPPDFLPENPTAAGTPLHSMWRKPVQLPSAPGRLQVLDALTYHQKRPSAA